MTPILKFRDTMTPEIEKELLALRNNKHFGPIHISAKLSRYWRFDYDGAFNIAMLIKGLRQEGYKLSLRQVLDRQQRMKADSMPTISQETVEFLAWGGVVQFFKKYGFVDQDDSKAES